ncbi:MAG: UvrB/UvrC motif-containing protein [Candidatus Sungbacteria bacterium]|uniref:UvrB/UvrC motif-containing protein n=1 Tax=Candidatus Sungiibacteriota bacterium TaxID=2750080 RepID=A0A932QY18_9BACT|nr:UvrB/UvrC motif-containing protein [Candidatus Sungbacteria bacterium]
MVKKPKAIPNSPGVYIFKQRKTPIYIGKAADLKKRLASYFRRSAGDKVSRLRSEATALEWIQTSSEIEALIREAELVKRHVPKFNVLLRDDKSYFYVAFTREVFPRVFIVHKTNLDNGRYGRIIGPFTSGSALRSTLKFLRRTFPYCTCATAHKRPCLNVQIGRCFGYCCIRKNQKTGIKNQAEYQKSIRNIIAILSGERKRILSRLKRDMREASKKQDFESAGRFRNQIQNIENIFRHRLMLEKIIRFRHASGAWSRIETRIRQLLGDARPVWRVEGYDISNISGTEATGSMVVFVNGKPARHEYKKFKIKTVRGANDVAMHREVMARRLAHTEWGLPDLILIDGGKPQLNAVRTVLRPGNETIRLAALAKREEELYIEGRTIPVRLDSLPPDTMLFFQRVRDESHRFAKKYHHKLREIAYRENRHQN